MKLHEYQAKLLLKKFGIPTPEGILISNSDEALKNIEELNGPPWVIKAQIHAGGRGKGGGVKIVNTLEEVKSATDLILGQPLVTKQTGPDGKRVQNILIEECVNIDQELYIAIVVDRKKAKPVMVFSNAGGMEIEEVAKKSPELILNQPIDCATGWLPNYGRVLAYRINPLPSGDTLQGLILLMGKLYKLFVSLDCSLVEINPLVISKERKILAVDAKITIDDNALFRQKEVHAFKDPFEMDPLEQEAEQNNLNYIHLDGNIGVMVNGAGLAMATMDMIKFAGAEPANFLDVGGGASEYMISKGFDIILRDEKVKAILINIFGGILRCDVLARGVLAAAKGREIGVPIIVRLEGTNVEEGRKILADSDLRFLIAKDMVDAANLISGVVSET